MTDNYHFCSQLHNDNTAASVSLHIFALHSTHAVVIAVLSFRFEVINSIIITTVGESYNTHASLLLS